MYTLVELPVILSYRKFGKVKIMYVLNTIWHHMLHYTLSKVVLNSMDKHVNTKLSKNMCLDKQDGREDFL